MHREAHGFVLGQRHEEAATRLNGLGQISRLEVKVGPVRFQALHLEKIVHQPRQPGALVTDDSDETALVLLGQRVQLLLEHLGVEEYRGQRRAQIVRHDRQDVGLDSGDLFQLLALGPFIMFSLLPPGPEVLKGSGQGGQLRAGRRRQLRGHGLAGGRVAQGRL